MSTIWASILLTPLNGNFCFNETNDFVFNSCVVIRFKYFIKSGDSMVRISLSMGSVGCDGLSSTPSLPLKYLSYEYLSYFLISFGDSLLTTTLGFKCCEQF